MPETKQYTKNEVANQQKEGKTVIILHDKVYDVTRFLNEHPGGEEILLDHAGKDSSQDFDDVGHSQDAFDLMKSYLIGELVESERTNQEPKKPWTATYGTRKADNKSGSNNNLISAAIAVLVLALYWLFV